MNMNLLCRLLFKKFLVFILQTNSVWLLPFQRCDIFAKLCIQFKNIQIKCEFLKTTMHTLTTGWIAIEFSGWNLWQKGNFENFSAHKWTQNSHGLVKTAGETNRKIPKLCKMQTVKKLTKMNFRIFSCSEFCFELDVTKVSFGNVLGGLSYEIKYSIPIFIYEWDGKKENNHAQCASRDSVSDSSRCTWQ